MKKTLKIFPILIITRSGQSIWCISSCLNLITKQMHFDLLFLDCFNNFFWSIKYFNKKKTISSELPISLKTNKII